MSKRNFLSNLNFHSYKKSYQRERYVQVVGLLVEVMRYKPVGRWFDIRLCH